MWTFATTERARALVRAEQNVLSPSATAKRVADFERGRHAAHSLLKEVRRGRPVEAVLPEASGPQRGRPRLLTAGRWARAGLSITHAGTVAVAAFAPSARAGNAEVDTRVGVDVVEVEDHGAAFRAEAFHPSERGAFSHALGDVDSAVVDCVAFAAKEAALKVLGVGLREGLRQVCVEAPAELPLHAMEVDRVEGWTPAQRFLVTTPTVEQAMVGFAFRLESLVGVLLLASS